MLTKNINGCFLKALNSNIQAVETDIIGTEGTPIKNATYKTSQSWSGSFPPILMKKLANPNYLGEQLGSYTVDVYTTSGVVFGNGTAEPTINDTNLSGDYVLGLSNSNVLISNEYEIDETGVTYTTLYSITNSTGAPITISELGIFDYYYGTNNGAGTAIKKQVIPYMIERVLLETPITIPINGIGQVTYTFRMNIPVVEE